MSSIVVTDHRVDSHRPGLTVLLRNKRRADLDAFGPARTVLFVHGATYPSTVTFDYAIDGKSWMDLLAEAGFDTWCVDLLGYGGSDRPPEMAAPAQDNTPIVDTADATRDAGNAVNFILAARGLPRLCLIGYSWGTAICGGLAAARPDAVERLVLSGALWLKVGSSAIMGDGPLGAYRTVEAEATIARWKIGLDAEQAASLCTPEHMATWGAAAIASDPESAHHAPPRLRAPTGVVKDVIAHWLAQDPTYDPGAIRAPTLVVVGAWDAETTPRQGFAVYERLTAAPTREMVVIPGGTHSLLLEDKRVELHRVVRHFLEAGTA